MAKDCTQPQRIGRIRPLNGCAGRLSGAATLHSHKNSDNKSNRKAINRNWSNRKPNLALKTIQYQDGMELRDRKNKPCSIKAGKIVKFS